MTRIFFWSADSSGCCHYRCELPATALADCGHQTLVSTVMPDGWMNADVIVGQRVCKPGPTQRWQELAKAGNSKMVYEVDDDLFSVDASSAKSHAFFSRPDIQANIKSNIAVADVVTVSTEPLAELLRPLNPNVVVLPNCIPAWVLDLPAPDDDPEVLTIGWGGSATHQMDFDEIRSELTRFIARNSNTQMHLMGWAPENLWRQLPPNQRCYTDWVHSVNELYKIIDFYIGIAPLRAHVFNRCKSPIKALEYAALGIPCVASDFGPYSTFIQNGMTGFLVSRPHEWPTYLRVLANNHDLRSAMGKSARTYASQFTIESNIHLWEKALLCS